MKYFDKNMRYVYRIMFIAIALLICSLEVNPCFGQEGGDPPTGTESDPIVVSITLTDPSSDYVGQTNPAYTIVTSPTGYESEVSVSLSPSSAISIGLNTATATLNGTTAQCNFYGVDTTCSIVSVTPMDEYDDPASLSFSAECDGLDGQYTVDGDLTVTGDTTGTLYAGTAHSGSVDLTNGSFSMGSPTFLDGRLAYGLGGLRSAKEQLYVMAASTQIAASISSNPLQNVGPVVKVVQAALQSHTCTLTPNNGAAVLLQVHTNNNAWAPKACQANTNALAFGDTVCLFDLSWFPLWTNNPGAEIDVAAPSALTTVNNGVTYDFTTQADFNAWGGSAAYRASVGGAGQHLFDQNAGLASQASFATPSYYDPPTAGGYGELWGPCTGNLVGVGREIWTGALEIGSDSQTFTWVW